jgi:hypothetical protein
MADTVGKEKKYEWVTWHPYNSHTVLLQPDLGRPPGFEFDAGASSTRG